MNLKFAKTDAHQLSALTPYQAPDTLTEFLKTL